MYFNLQNFTLPDFGLMTAADKQKLDGINSSTYLTTAAASSTYLTQAAASETYATKAEVRQYIRQVLESDTGYVFLNGNSSEVGVINALVALQNPNLTVTMNGTPIGDSYEMVKEAGYSSAYFDVSRSGSGVITVNDTSGYLSFDNSTNQINQSFGKWAPNDGDSTIVTVNLASDGTYDTGTKVFTVTYKDAGAVEPEMPEPVG